MSANATACKLRVLVGPSELDFSENIVSFVCGFDKRDRSGLLKISGNLVLGVTYNTSSLMNPRLNTSIDGVIPQALWSRGQRIKVECTDSTGAWVTHPVGYLYILREPNCPSIDNPKLTLQVGCILSLRDFAEPNDDKSGISTGVSTTRTDLIASLLSAAGVSNWSGTVSSYPINYPISKLQGSYVQQAGEVAFAALRALKQARTGIIQAIDLAIDANESPLVVAAIGRDEIEYTPSEGAETPVEELTCCSTTYDVTDTWGVVAVCEYGKVPGSTKVIRITCTEDGQDENGIYHKVTVQEPLGLLLPNDYPGVETMALSSETIDREYYEAKEGGKLLYTDRQVIQLFAVAVREFWNGLSDAQKASYFALTHSQAERTITTFQYSDKELLKERFSRTTNMLGAVLPDIDPLETPVSNRVPASSSYERYEEVTPGQWRYVSSSAEPLIDAFPDAISDDATTSEKIQLVTVDYTPSISNSGQNQPPAAERRPERYAKTEKPIEGKCQIGTYPGSNQQERSRTIEVPYCVSQEQLEQIARVEAARLLGARQGQRVKLPFLDEFIYSDEPLPIIHCREPRHVESSPGNYETVYDTIVFQADSIQYVHDRKQAIVAFDCTWVATIPAGTTTPRLPYTPVNNMRGGIRVGGTSPLYDYSLDPVSLLALGGIRVGGKVNRTSFAGMAGGIRVGGELDATIVKSMNGGVLVGGSSTAYVSAASMNGGVLVGGVLTASGLDLDWELIEFSDWNTIDLTKWNSIV